MTPRASKLPPVTTEDEARWVWEVPTPLLAVASGDIAALFKAEGVEAPGFLEANAPTPDASLFAREAIQNSWDAAREWRSECARTKRRTAPFYLEFKFSELTGFEKRRVTYELGLDEHARQLAGVKSAKRGQAGLGLPDGNVLDDLTNAETPLRILTMSEHGGLGMPGSFLGGDSRMLQALLRVGYTLKAQGAGGSFGYGKAGLIAASAIRTVIAYSAFVADPEDKGVTRRLLGVTYWKPHKVKGIEYNGWARLGEKMPWGDIMSAVPFENDEADKVASALGLQLRDSEQPGQTGTTFMIVDPTISPEDLRAAIERYWWPAMMDPSDGLKVRILDYDGTEIVPTVPRNDRDMNPFIRAFELASRPQDVVDDTEASIPLGSYKPHDSTSDYNLGRLGVVADPQGWSFPEDEGVDHCTLIALVRGPRMVVNYYNFKRNLGVPHVRGVFLADPSVDDLLRQTEDKAHTKWETTKLAGTHPHSQMIASQVQVRLRDKVAEFKNRFKKPPPRPGDLNLPILDELSRLMRGRKPKTPDPERRQVEIRILTPAHATAERDGSMVCRATVEVAVADWVWSEITVDEVTVSVSLNIAYVEDERLGDSLLISARCDNRSFGTDVANPGRLSFTGQLGRAEKVRFDVQSDPYASDWTVRFTPTAQISEPKVRSSRSPREGGER